MSNNVWQTAISSSADPQRSQRGYEKFCDEPSLRCIQDYTESQAQILCALFSGSRYLSELLLSHPHWLEVIADGEALHHPRRKQGLQRDVTKSIGPFLQSLDYQGALREIRLFKQRELLRVGTRDLAQLGELPELLLEMSNIADVCLDAVFQVKLQQQCARLGQPYHRGSDGRWQSTESCVLGMGKLGGCELNYSSDVDVIFVYSDEGCVFKRKPSKKTTRETSLTNHQFFNSVAEEFAAEVGRSSTDGNLYRIDLRLRPEGKSGPLSRSIESYETFYAQWGQSWERMMLIKARCVAGSAAVEADFLEAIHSFRYPRLVSERVIREVSAIKSRIETEVIKTGEIDRNVKLGRGGIREVEFVVQTLQLLNAGKYPFLQDSQTLSALGKLVRYNLLSEEESEKLSEAYQFLRSVEHRLQMDGDQQTHTIPTDKPTRERLAALMGFATLAAFERNLKSHRVAVRRVYERLIKPQEHEKETPFPKDFDSGKEQWKALLTAHGFRDADQSFHHIKEFVNGPGFVHVSPRTRELAIELIKTLLSFCPSAQQKRTVRPKIARGKEPKTDTGLEKDRLSDPDRVLTRLDSFVAAYGTRALVYESWTSNPGLFHLFMWLFDRSEFLAELAIRVPDLVEDLQMSGQIRRQKSSEEALADLRHGLGDRDQSAWLRRYHQAELMRIGLRDILGLADFDQILLEVSALADACLTYALEIVIKRHRLSKSPFTIIGLGKLGGSELNFGSDLDVMFVTNGTAKSLPKLQPIAADLMDLLSARTEHGTTFEVDARLRPDGTKGLLVSNLKAYEDYYFNRAMIWEIQALSRTRFIAGDPQVGTSFQSLTKTLTDFSSPPKRLAAYSSDWISDINKMRQRIENERVPGGKDHLAIKTGVGGLMDVEFLAQIICLKHGLQEANTLKCLESARDQKYLPLKDANALIKYYVQLRRLEGILRRWSFEGETLLPDNPEPLYRVAVRCGYTDSDSLFNAVGRWRKNIRAIYKSILRPPKKTE